MTLRSRPWQLILLLIGCGFLLATGIGLLAIGDARYGWWCVGVFGFFTLAAIVSMLPGSSSLNLDPEGMMICSYYRKTFVRWADVQEFIPVQVRFRVMVGWKFIASYPRHRIGREASSVLAGVEAALPSSYGMSAEGLSALLNDWRLRHAGPAVPLRNGVSVTAAGK